MTSKSSGFDVLKDFFKKDCENYDPAVVKELEELEKPVPLRLLSLTLESMDIQKLKDAVEAAKSEQPTQSSSIAVVKETVAPVQHTKEIRPIAPDEYKTIPSYMSSYLSLADLNLMREALEKAVNHRLLLRKTKFNEASKTVKDKILKIRNEQEGLKLDKTSQYCSEDEWKAVLPNNLKPKVKWASQMFTHLKRSKEKRFDKKIFYILIL
uniref:Uncharacterized protein n=1 Tax=Panagrolaimus sp. JU765 TaxID=591449 RepID=A0AC34R8U0_9BILA